MALSKTEKRLVWVLVIVAVLGVTYDIFSGSSSSAPVSSSTATTTPVGQDILALVEKLKVISIDPTIFSSTVFTSLKSSEAQLNPEIQGRADPFSVIGVDAPFTTSIAEPTQNTTSNTGSNTQSDNLNPSDQTQTDVLATSTTSVATSTSADAGNAGM